MDELLLLVKPQEDLPKIGKVLSCERMISGKPCDFKVKKITGLRWNKRNDLIVAMQGTYVLKKS